MDFMEMGKAPATKRTQRCDRSFQEIHDHINMEALPAFKQHALDEKIKATYQDKANLMNQLNPPQEQQFNIPIKELLLMLYNIRKAWLRSSELYIQRAETHNALS
jgi:hypothetical protein